MSDLFAQVPATAAVSPPPFKVSIADEKTVDMHQLAKLGPITYENTQKDHKYGITHAWLANGKEEWLKYYLHLI